MSSFELDLEALDDDQRVAATAPRGPVCILAGAGTGKTRTITYRIAHLVDQGFVSPQRVLAVTFTSKAAGEMRDRLLSMGLLAFKHAPSTPLRCANCGISGRRWQAICRGVW